MSWIGSGAANASIISRQYALRETVALVDVSLTVSPVHDRKISNFSGAGQS